MEVLIIGAGIGGLTLGLMLHRAGIACRIFEAAPELKAVGVGINILPHASRELCALGLEGAVAVSCEGIHSVLRKQLYPDEGPPKYSGINMWRGVTRWQPILTGASMFRIGWMCRSSSAAPTPFWNIPWSIRTRCRAGVSAG